MGRANVQVVSTRAGLHSLAHRYGRTISVFTKVSSSDRIILNQYSIRGDALWYALPALRLADANSGSHRGSRRGPKDSRLPRPAIPVPSCVPGSPQPTTHTHRILTATGRFRRRVSARCHRFGGVGNSSAGSGFHGRRGREEIPVTVWVLCKPSRRLGGAVEILALNPPCARLRPPRFT